MNPRVLMLGWELPPYNSGGLGVACLGLAKALASNGTKITFILPKRQDIKFDFMNIMFADIKEITDLKKTYTTSMLLKDFEQLADTGLDFVNASLAFGRRVRQMAAKIQTDVIHAHDWLTFPAGISAKTVTGKPLIAHIHSTEYDRTGGHFPNPYVYEIEKRGLDYADRVISVSDFTKKMIVDKYGINERKVDVVHNGVETFERSKLPPALVSLKKLGYKVVLFLGRITLMKGPEYFVRAAKIVLDYEPKTVFVVVGTGDMQEVMIAEAGRLNILDKMLFTGFLRGEEKHKIYQAADLYVMPSVSEPFGITTLESIQNGTPVLVSKQSGVSEVVKHALKVDFWDVEEIANKTLAVISYPHLGSDLINESKKELPLINWSNAAYKCLNVYRNIV